VQWIPVSPAAEVAFAADEDTGAKAADALDASAVEDTRVSNQEISVSLASSLNIGGIFSGSVSANEVGYWLDAMAYSDRYEELTTPNGLVLANRFGFGLRIMFRVRKLNPKANLNYGLLGAAIDAGYARASYEINALGFGAHAAEALAIILEGVASSGTELSSDTFYKLNKTILKNLTEYIKANVGSLQPTRIAALVRRVSDDDSLDTSLAILFAMRQIRGGKSLQDALASAGDLDSAAIRLTYANVLGDVDESAKPTSINKSTADEWLADK
jgi:hypothetical protein